MLMDLKREDPEQYMTAIEMYMDYAFDGTEPELSGKSLVTKLFWKASKPLIDANNKNYVNGCKGGAPKGNKNAKSKTTQKQPSVESGLNKKTTQKQGNVTVNDTDTVTDTLTDNENKRNPYVDINTMTITDFDKYDEWNEAHGIVEG